MKLDPLFYQRNQVTVIARELLGKELVTRISGKITSGIIVETEAYSYSEKGCHAYNGRKTERNKVMFEHGGVSYVYLCYGIHHLFNVVTNVQGVADAVLIRALEPHQGQNIMLTRMATSRLDRITSGPGKLTKALGIDRTHNMESLLGKKVWIEDNGISLLPSDIQTSPRIGIDYAGKDALLPWRFSISGNRWVSKF